MGEEFKIKKLKIFRKLTTLIVIFILLLVNISCDAFSERTCHLAAKEYVRNLGHEKIIAAEYEDYHSVIVTADSLVFWVSSCETKYPYVGKYKIIADFRRTNIKGEK